MSSCPYEITFEGAYNSKPSKEHADALIEELKHEHEIATNGVIAAEDLVEVSKSVDSGEETTVQPTSSLKNEVCHLGRDICFTSS